MGIQEDIKQSKFRNAYQKAFINIIYTNNWLQQRVRDILKNEDLTNQQFNVLRILRGAYPDPISTLQIRNRMLDKMSDSSRIVDRLVKKGLAEKKPCADDKRLVDVIITDQGLQTLANIDEKESHIDDSLGSLSVEEAEELSRLLDKVRV